MLKKIKSEKAQSLVEMALLMPILVLIIGGLLDLGRAYFTFIALSDAAAEGASYASIYPQDTFEIIQRATESTSGGMVVIDPSMVTVETGELVAGTPVTVTVDYDFELILPVMTVFVPDGIIHMRSVATQPILGN